ncbi:MAG: 3'-5' exonuclease [Hydrogenophaga sp.]|uniref:3'-5' exonuclease n=1 Tax=Hydrogenophaga sp. TaxID=1904254 RepID=UPI003D9B080B
MSQFSFDFDPPKAPPVEAVPPSTAATAGPTPEDMARQLDAHPDYRVLRRLVPTLDHGPAPASHPAGVQRVLVLDTETTGLSHASDKIIELAMLLVQVDVATGQPFGPVDTFEGFEDPGMPIPEVAKQVTGISDEMVRGQRLDDAQVQALVDRADLVVAHNAGFDRPFVEARFPGFAHKPWACSFADIDWRALGAESAKLSALAQDQGWFYDAHRALVDCHALLQVLSQRVGEHGGDGQVNGLQRLMAAAGRPSFKLRATGSPFDSKDKLKARGYRWDGEGKVWFCSLGSEAALADELAWLQAEVYGGRRAQVEVEALDALTRYALRPGLRQHRSL